MPPDPRSGPEHVAQPGDSFALEDDLGLGVLRAVQELAGKSFADLRLEALEQPARMVGLRVEREPHPKPELRIVLEERVAPGGAASGRVHGPRRRR